MLLCDASRIAILCIHALASCIPFRYARCTVRGHEAHDNFGAKPEDDVGGWIQKMEGPRAFMPERERLIK
jgi:hypothetical protein